MQVWNVLHAARWKCRTEKIAKKWPSEHHRTTLSGYIFATKAHIYNQKNLLNSHISPTCPRNMVNFGPLAAETVSLVWGTPTNFNGFRVLAALLHGSQVSGWKSVQIPGGNGCTPISTWDLNTFVRWCSDGHFLAIFSVLHFQRAACSTFQTCILNSH